MNKKTNSILFILGATVVNVIIVAVIFILLLALYGVALQKLLPDSADWFVLVSFVLSIVGGFFVYRTAIKILSKRIDMDKYFDPLFLPRKRK